MFKTDPDLRLHIWFEFRSQLEISEAPLEDLVTFWYQAPLIPHNHLIDPYFNRDWPTPWEIIERNKYDDFTLSLMMGWTLLLTDRYKNSQVEIRTVIDDNTKRVYNILCVDNKWALNFQDHSVVPLDSVPSLYRVENIVPLQKPR
jgi:hypothetical protein